MEGPVQGQLTGWRVRLVGKGLERPQGRIADEVSCEPRRVIGGLPSRTSTTWRQALKVVNR